VPAVTIESPVRTALAFGTRLSIRSPGLPGVDSMLPGSLDFASSAETPKSWSVSSITTAELRDTLSTLPHEALAVEDRVVDLDAVARALVDLDPRGERRRRAGESCASTGS
jgi:hypothetical protein